MIRLLSLTQGCSPPTPLFPTLPTPPPLLQSSPPPLHPPPPLAAPSFPPPRRPCLKLMSLRQALASHMDSGAVDMQVKPALQSLTGDEDPDVQYFAQTALRAIASS